MSDTKPLALKWRLTDGLISWSYGTVDVIEQKAYDELEAELAALKAKIDDAPWVYSEKHVWTGMCVEYHDKYRAKLVNVEKLDVLDESPRLAETKSGE